MIPAQQDLQLDAQNPWPGLATYDETTREFFFGREAEVDELLRLIKLSPLTTLYGKSGLGKSSLLKAGLFPKLREAYFLPVYIRLDTANAATMPFLEQAAYWFREALQAAKADYPPFAEGENLWCYLHRRDLEIWSPDNHLLTPVLVFDQFEEVFAGANPDLPPPRVLCHGLADLIENKLPADFASGSVDKPLMDKLDLLSQRYRVVLSFREDFLPALKNWERDVPSLLKNWCQLKPMSRECAVNAVTQSGSAILADSAATEIVDFVGNLDQARTDSDTDIEPVLLSLCCFQLNVRRQTTNAARIDVDLLRKVGQEILAGYYANALSSMPRTVSKFIETKLIQGDRYRSSYPVKLALDEGLLATKQLSELTDKHRLLRIDQQMGTPRIELIHDRLVSVVRKARDRHKVGAQIKLAWLAASILALVLALVLLTIWQKWEQSIQADLLIQTAESLENRLPALKMTNQTGQSKRIYIQILDGKQLDAAKNIQEILKNNHFAVPEIEILAKGPEATEVRYFRKNELAKTQEIADLLTEQNIPDVSVRYIAGFENSIAIPPGQYEIWFAPDAFR